MPPVLTTASTLTCKHGGTVVVQASTSALTADGNPVLVQADITAATITGCPNTNASSGQAPCLKITSVLTGVSTVLKVANQPVMLANASGLTDGVPPLPVMWQVTSPGQNLLESR
jgi:hypothetical protein